MSEASQSIEISIVMPCLNEAKTLEKCIKQGLLAIAEANLAGEIIIADNGSTDGSQAIAARCGVRVVDVQEKGYGNALRTGITAARGRFVLMGDADCSYDFGHVKFFVEKLRSGFDLVMGNRFKGGIAPGAMPWKNRHIGNPALTAVGRVLFKSPSKDFHCGLRAFTKEAFEKMALKTGGMEFASEMVIRATLLNMRITEIPTTLQPDERDRPPHLRPWRDGWRHLRFMLLYSPRWLFLYPGLLLIALGTLLGARLLWSTLEIGGVVLDIHTLFFCLVAVLMGVQSVFFAIMTKKFAIHNKLTPPDPLFAKAMEYFTLEAGIVLGGMLLCAGLTLASLAILQWGLADFGELSPQSMLRLVIPGGFLLAIGCQTILSSFFLSILDLNISGK